ncbi:MAG: hypothetical protein LBD57_00355, partial [Endomicrobium sp.]|uniref:hypothetical protein n=1 Tax=Candidatus Endomicrobiellum cubanum TaxID=3242325 RepID=UPI00281A8DFE|nr:hypothetical protein [Endomicrobium sp.]
KNDSSNPITLTSSFYLDNNSINISSYCNVYRIYAAFLDLVSDRDAVYHPSTISVSSNSISISSSISNYSQIYFAYLSLYNCEVDNLLINNNTLSFTASDPNNDDFTFSVASTINSFCNDAGLLARFDLSNNFYIALLLNLGTLLPTSSF